MGNICKRGFIAPIRVTWMVMRQKSAEVIVAKCREECPGHGEGLNIKRKGGIHGLCIYNESEWRSNLQACCGSTVLKS
jgi:hypothetical protein